MLKKLQNLPKLFVAVGIGLALVAVVLLFLLGGKAGQETADEDVSRGLAYLTYLEEKDPAAVQQVRDAIHQRERDEYRDGLISDMTSGKIDPFELMRNSVIMGDTRAVSFWYRHFVEKEQVLAGSNHTIRKVREQMDTLVELAPDTIFLCYGLNDCFSGYWETSVSYVTEYIQTIKELQEALPDTTIVVSSILPVRDIGFESCERWHDLPAWSAALEQACRENGILFANCDKLATDYPNLWDPDGIRFRKEFYPYWASYLVAAVLMEGVE